MFIRLLRKIGIHWLTWLITCLAILLSVAITMSVYMVSGLPPSKLGIYIAILAPATIAPLFNYVTLTLLARLDQKEQQMRELSTIDGLTQVHNRRHIVEVAEQERRRAFRLNHPLSVAILDVDYFKNINDTYGHPGGDEVLKEIAFICKQNSREIDHFARYGGEEFIYILPEADAQTAFLFAERIRNLLATTKVIYQAKQIEVTASIGVATLSADESLDALLLRADQALYKAKDRGKNLTVMA
jgi:diguanylate cyclase (GGDEF)-like protein